MYRFPPLALRAASGALIAGNVITVLLAAPGAGFAYRVKFVSLYITRGVGAGAQVDISLQEVASGIIFEQIMGASIAGKPGMEVDHSWPGYQCSTNDGIQVNISSTVAGGNVVAVLHYYVDDVS